MSQRTTIALLAAMLATATPAIASAKARAELRPAEPSVGQPAQLVVTIDGDDGSAPDTIRTDAATLRLRGRMSRMFSTNGSTRHETVFSYSFVPERTGALDIPAIAIATQAGTLRTEPIHATVTDAPQRAPSARSSTAPSGTPSRRDEPARAFVKLDVPDRSLVVGQAVPIKIHAYFRAGTAVTLQGPPTLSSDAFTLSDLSDTPTQREVELRGEPYLLATWTAILSPAKPSTGKLFVELPVEIAYRERRAQPRRSIQDLLDRDPFAAAFGSGSQDPFDAFFNGADPFAGFAMDLDAMMDLGEVRRRTLTLKTSGGTVKVEDPPTAHRPAGYGGAVGSFDLAIVPPAGELRVGEPAELTMRVTGRGNFDRVSLPAFEDSARMNAYTIASTFAPSKSKLSGTKTFTQTIVPTQPGELELPAIALSYFDPDTQQYRIAKTEPLRLVVQPAPGLVDATPSAAAAATAEPHHGEPGRATLAPRYRDRTFWLLPGAIALVTLVLAGAGWWRRSEWIADRLRGRRVDRAVSRSLAKADSAARDGDVVEFFGAARRAFQLRIGEQFGIAPDAVTARDVVDHMGDRSATITTLFELADHVDYAHGESTAESLDHWRSVVHAELARLEAHR
ncbi:MAG: BatD family protein [Kofleriaceae bacterium]